MKLEKYINDYKNNMKVTIKLLIADVVMVFLFSILYCLSKDLELSNLNSFSSSVLVISFFYVLIEMSLFIGFLICLKVKEKKDKKLEIEKIIDEESKKD